MDTDSVRDLFGDKRGLAGNSGLRLWERLRLLMEQEAAAGVLFVL